MDIQKQQSDPEKTHLMEEFAQLVRRMTEASMIAWYNPHSVSNFVAELHLSCSPSDEKEPNCFWLLANDPDDPQTRYFELEGQAVRELLESVKIYYPEVN